MRVNPETVVAEYLARSENNISAHFAEEFNIRWLYRAAAAAATSLPGVERGTFSLHERSNDVIAS